MQCKALFEGENQISRIEKSGDLRLTKTVNNGFERRDHMATEHICDTPCGPVRGKAAQPGVTAYRGIRYAEAGRWMYPRVVKNWDGVYDASHFGPNAIQQGKRNNPDGSLSFYDREFRLDLPYTYSEDCQYLNIYAPDKAEKAPVIVYIHGGAFMGGSGWNLVFDTPVWPEHGVIAVTLNYRLGVFGSVFLPELIEESGQAGNYNLYDQLAALQWVHDNIATFGGDPENVTLMGQSAGARSVQMLVGSPKVRGLVHRAVMSSGGGVPSHLFTHVPDDAESLDFWQAWKQNLGAETLEDLRKLSSEKLLKSLGRMMQTRGFPQTVANISPRYDNSAFPKPACNRELPNGWLEIPYLCGGNVDDIVPGLVSDGRSWAKNRRISSYAYCFARKLPGDENGAWHSADLWYWFGTMHRCWRPFAEADYALKDTMVAYLMNFARSGDPNGEGLPKWIRAQDTDSVMWLDGICGMGAEPDISGQKGLSL